MSEPVIVGCFHRYPVGARVWECTTCGGHFVWNKDSSRWGNAEYAAAVFCSDSCAAKWRPTKANRKRIVMAAGYIDNNRVHLVPSPPKAAPND